MKNLILSISLCGFLLIPSLLLNSAEISEHSETTDLKNLTQYSDHQNPGRVKRYTKKMIKLIKRYSVLASKVAEDKKIDDKELAALIKMGNDITDFENKMDKYFEENPSAQEISDKYIDDHKAEMETLYEVFMNSVTNLYDCEGAEKLDL